MGTTLEGASRFQDLLTTEDPRQQYAFVTIFDDSGFRARRRSKWKFRMLQRISPKLRAILRDGEKVRYLTRGTRFSFWEAYFIGWIMNLLNRRAIVVTDQRLLLMQIGFRSQPKELLEQIRFPCIRKVSRTLAGNTKLLLGNGKKVVFAYVPRADRAFLGRLIGYTQDHLAAEPLGVENLCAHCHAVVDGRPTRCSACGGGFKSSRKAALRSLIFPGLGDWYLGHRGFATAEVGFAALIWLGALVPNPDYPMTLLGLLFSAILIVLVVHVPDSLLTRYIANRGLYPEPARNSFGEERRLDAE